MRVLMTTDTLGGVWTFTQELTSGLLQRDCAVALVSFGGVASEAQLRWSRSMQDEWRKSFHYQGSDIPLEWMEDNQRAYNDAAPLLMQLSQEFKATLLHSNQFCFGALPLEIPKVITAHSDVLSWAECCRNGHLDDSGWLRQYRRLVSHGLSEAEVTVAPTNWMAEALTRNFGVKQIKTIPNGRSLSIVKGASKKLQAVTAGRLWDEAKNISLLRDVRSPMPLLVAGERQHGSAMAVDALGEAQLIGSLSQDSLFKLFHESAIYICTSRYEPFGLAPLEAALCGCAILANDIPSLREVWRSDALYFTGADSLTRLLHKLFDNPELLSAAQEQSIRRALGYSAGRMTEEYLQTFRQIVARTEEAVYAS